MGLNPFVLLLIVLAFAVPAWYYDRFLKRKIQPRRSVKNFILYFLAVLASAFLLTVLVSLVILWLAPKQNA